MEKAVRRYRRLDAQFQYLLFRLVQALALGDLAGSFGPFFGHCVPGGIGRFLLCDIGANHCRLQHIGWEKCGHGFTSKPQGVSLGGVLE